MAKVRLDEVAKDAGVSKATVSMVLNHNPLVADATRERVWESIKRTGYVYNRAAASLRKQQSNAAGMIINTLMNPYYAEVVESLQNTLDSRGIDVLLGVSGDDPERQQRLLMSMAGRRVDGVVMVPAQGCDGEAIRTLAMPTVLLTRRVEGIEADYVGADNSAGAKRVTEHLLDVHGVRRIAFFGGAPHSSGREERLRGFIAACTEHGIGIDPAAQLPCGPDRREARERSRDLLATGDLEAVVCYNDVAALGVLDSATELGLQVGHDIRITGFDNVEDSAFAVPPLTSVSFDSKRAGEVASELLLARIEGSKEPFREVIMETILVPRASCGC